MAAEFTDKEVASALRVDPRTIQRWCKAGKLPGAYKAGRSWRIPQKTLRQLQLADVPSSDETERELIAAGLACRELEDELDRIESRANTRLPRDWTRLANQLRVLRAELGDLPERASEAASTGPWPALLPAGWPRRRRLPHEPEKEG
jgi:excisionase family DNA binding protein